MTDGANTISHHFIVLNRALITGKHPLQECGAASRGADYKNRPQNRLPRYPEKNIESSRNPSQQVISANKVQQRNDKQCAKPLRRQSRMRAASMKKRAIGNPE